MEREIPNKVGGYYRAPGMGQGLRQENGDKRIDLRNSTERKQTEGYMNLENEEVGLEMPANRLYFVLPD